ncbi:MAG: putative toxin-antitoxin system toxin component, PIN family [Actinomycetota bacterium]|nr:putative toxin-antitoxin system toxin component, PIN family [Actinomycetota bacterium]
MRVVLDPNVLVSALISPSGPPREIVDAWIAERFDLVVSPALLAELDGVLARPKFRRWVSSYGGRVRRRLGRRRADHRRPSARAGSLS